MAAPGSSSPTFETATAAPSRSRDLEPLGQRIDGRHVRAGARRRDGSRAARAARSRRRPATCPRRPQCGASAPTQQASGSASTARRGSSPAGTSHERPPRHHDLLGEDAGPVHADQLPRGAEVVLAGQAALAGAAGDERIDRVARPVDQADDLVPEHERRDARPGMTAVAVQVGAADPGELDVEHDLVRGGLRLRQRRRG